MSVDARLFRIFRLVVLAWLLGWFFKFTFFSTYFRHIIHAFPVTHEQFPSFFTNNVVSMLFYFLPVVVLPALFIPRRIIAMLTAGILLLASIVSGLHINTYNDMTFVSSFWVALWLLWLSIHIHNPQQAVVHGPRLIKCLIGMIFLGGTVGKLTDEYWNGEVFYNTVVKQTPGFFGLYLRENFPLDQQHAIVALISKLIIIVEAALVFSPLYPYRFFTIFGVFSVCMLVVFRSWQILSVLSCLTGMILGGLLLVNYARELRQGAQQTIKNS